MYAYMYVLPTRQDVPSGQRRSGELNHVAVPPADGEQDVHGAHLRHLVLGAKQPHDLRAVQSLRLLRGSDGGAVISAHLLS